MYIFCVFQGIIDERKKKEDALKRKEFQRLKDQMTQDLKRRAKEEDEAKEEDKEFMAKLTRQVRKCLCIGFCQDDRLRERECVEVGWRKR